MSETKTKKPVKGQTWKHAWPKEHPTFNTRLKLKKCLTTKKN